MPEAARLITDTTAYPTFASKAALMTAIRQEIEEHGASKDNLMQILFRLSNTDTSAFADPTGRHDA